MTQFVQFIKRRVLRLFFIPILVFVACPLWAGVYDFVVTISDENGEALIGVNVYTDDYSFSAVSDIDGKVTLSDLRTNTELNFTYIGYQSLKLPFYQIKKQNGFVQMIPVSEELETVVVIGRTDEKKEDIPFIVNSISQKDIAFTNPQTAADALASHGDVFVQKSQMGGGSPIVRGFEANKVLLVLDGVRMNNAIFRNGHLQNAISVDNSMLERVEVIFGPGSLMYGSEALGGVVHFRSKTPKLMLGLPPKGQDYIMETNAFTRYASANEEKTAHFDINYGKKNWASLTSFSVTDYNHLRAGSNRPNAYPNFGKRYHFATSDGGVDQVIENAIYDYKNGDTIRVSNADIQIGTEYSQIDLTQKVRYRPSDQLDFIANFQYSTTSNIPRYDQLSIIVQDSSDLKWSEWYYGPQQRLLASLKTKITQKTPLYDKATLIASFQKVDEERYKRKFAKDRRNFNVEDVFVYSFTADLDKSLDEARRRVVSYGADVNHNQVFSVAGTTNLSDKNGAVSYNQPTRYPSGGSTMTTAAAYANYRWKSIDSVLTVNLGARYTYAKVHALFSETDPIPWPTAYYTTGIGTTDSDLTWGAGFTMNSKTKWQLRVLAASAFRSPNVDDFSQVRVKNGYVSTPNPNLSSERAINGEVTIAKEIGGLRYVGEERRGTSFKISGTGFYTQMKNAIVRKDFPLLDGSTTLLIDEEFNITQANVNAASAFIYGFSGNLTLNMADKLKWTSSVSWTQGRQSFQDTVFVGATDTEMAIDTLVPLAHIPPMYGQSSLSYQFDKFRIEAVVRFNGRKALEKYAVTAIEANEDGGLELSRNGSSDNLQYAPDDGTYAWMTYNLYTSWQINEKFSLNVGLENIADLHYRLFASGVSAPGRNLIVSLRGTF